MPTNVYSCPFINHRERLLAGEDARDNVLRAFTVRLFDGHAAFQTEGLEELFHDAEYRPIVGELAFWYGLHKNKCQDHKQLAQDLVDEHPELASMQRIRERLLNGTRPQDLKAQMDVLEGWAIGVDKLTESA